MAVLSTFEICNPSDPDIIQSYPDVVYNGDNFQVVWSDEKFGAYYATTARVSPDGVVLDTGICISTGSGSYEYQPKIDFDGDRCLAVWPKDAGIQGRFIDHDGQPEGSVISITAGGSGPVLAFDGSNYLIAWFSGTYPSLNIKARLFSMTGIPLGSELILTTDNDCNRWPDVIYDGRQYFIVWTKGANSPASQYVWAQAVSTAGVLIGGNFLLSANTADQRWFPAIASSDTNYLVAWGQSGAASNVMGNVDHGLAGIKENLNTVLTKPVYRGPTFMHRIPESLIRGEARIFDISGREIVPEKIADGMYFIKFAGNYLQKIIIVK
jgi:hypothetical protein